MKLLDDELFKMETKMSYINTFKEQIDSIKENMDSLREFLTNTTRSTSETVNAILSNHKSDMKNLSARFT